MTRESGQSPERQPFLCFQRRAPGDVLVKGEKIAGSAQRRCRGAVLQHGSVLLARSPAAPELDGLKELTAQTISGRRIHTGVVGKAFRRHWPSRWQRGSLSDAHRRRAAELVKEKYGFPRLDQCQIKMRQVAFDYMTQTC